MYADRIKASSMPEPNSGCWLWLLRTDRYGYAKIKIGGDSALAHRVSYASYHGQIPAGMCVCHKCDVRACVNPDHLWLGTNAENTQDRERKGRNKAAFGEAAGHSKLTVQQVSAIRRDTRAQRAIAAEFGVSQAAVGKLKRRETWRSVA